MYIFIVLYIHPFIGMCTKHKHRNILTHIHIYLSNLTMVTLAMMVFLSTCVRVFFSLSLLFQLLLLLFFRTSV